MADRRQGDRRQGAENKRVQIPFTSFVFIIAIVVIIIVSIVICIITGKTNYKNGYDAGYIDGSGQNFEQFVDNGEDASEVADDEIIN